jgi:hypothetical protein
LDILFVLLNNFCSSFTLCNNQKLFLCNLHYVLKHWSTGAFEKYETISWSMGRRRRGIERERGGERKRERERRKTCLMCFAL